MKTLLNRCALATASALLLSIAAGAEPRIVTLGPCATEHLVLLGLEKCIVGVTLHDSPARKEGKRIVGTLREPNVEAIAALRPDAVVASKEGNLPEVARKLRGLGITVVVMEEFSSFADICDAFLGLGRRFGRGKEAEAIVAAEEKRLAGLKTRFARARKTTLFFCLGWKPLFTIGGKTYLDELVTAAGGTNIFADLGRKYAPVSLEEVVRKQPAAIVVLGMGDGDEAAMLGEMKLLEAVRAGRTLILDGTAAGSPTPRTFVDCVEHLGSFLATGEKAP